MLTAGRYIPIHHCLLLPLMTLLLLGAPMLLSGQSQTRDFCVELEAELLAPESGLRLSWTHSGDDIRQYIVYSKPKGALSWGAALTTLEADVSSFTVSEFAPGQSLEYRLIKQMLVTVNDQTGIWNSAGYVYAGRELPPTEYRGRLLLLVDISHAETLASELERLERDLTGDGWYVLRRDVDPDETTINVKQIILDVDAETEEGLEALFLFGHVPVPYSGNYSGSNLPPDGHRNHIGAWAADAYYGDLNGTWTDATTNITGSRLSANDNVPGDGKFDQSLLFSDVELQVGRVDLHDMPAFDLDESELLRRYLDRNHAYRHKQFELPERGLIDDNFGPFGLEAFAASAFRAFAPLIGRDNIVAAKYINTLREEGYLWSYACGGGTDTSAGGVGNTHHFAEGHYKTVFSMLFGSYFGDWNVRNNFLRAPLAADGYCLVNFWSGRPHWHLHHMAMGETVGYSMRSTINNQRGDVNYYGGLNARSVTIALMGDPSLRMHVVAPPGAVAAEDVNARASLSWEPSAGSVLGYYIYRAEDGAGPYERVHDELVTASAFVDESELHGDYTYMVRALALQQSPSGSYFNLSQGRFAEVTITAPLVTEGPQSTSYCAGASINVPFSINAAINPEEGLSVELSDANGSFASAQTIGSWTGSSGNSIEAIIPPKTGPGNAYRVRVVTADRAVIGIDNREDLSINPQPVAAFDALINGIQVRFTNESVHGDRIRWRFGDGSSSEELNPSHFYTNLGSYDVELIVDNDCGSDTLRQTISIVTLDVYSAASLPSLTIYPNPVQDFAVVSLELEQTAEVSLRIVDALGRSIYSEAPRREQGMLSRKVNLQAAAPGVYYLQIHIDETLYRHTVVIH